MSFDQAVNDAVKPVADAALGVIFWPVPLGAGAEMPLIVAWLMAGVLFCTFYFKFVNFRYFAQGMRLLRGKADEPGAPGNITYYQALASCLSATVGLGNIAGVAVGLSAGGPGAAVWLCLMGFLGMSAKFAEGTLAVKYRKLLPNGEYVGGPVEYLSEGFAAKGGKWTKFGLVLSFIFAICCIGGALGGGNMFQANQTYKQFLEITGGDTSWWADKAWLFGLVLSGLVALVIIGGFKSIVAATSIITPLMAAIYMVAGAIVIGVNFSHIGDALHAIFSEAFTPKAGMGAFLGAMVWGVRRAIFSNEAGLGSAGILHASTKTNYPAAAGMVAMLGAFFDTVVICMMTALVLVFSGVLPADRTSDIAGVELTSRAFAQVLPWFPYVLAVCVFLFAYSTIITWFYYGLTSARYLFGSSRAVDISFKVVTLVCVVLGTSLQLGTILDLGDAMFFIMAVPNLIGVYVLAPVVMQEFKKYEQVIKKQ